MITCLIKHEIFARFSLAPIVCQQILIYEALMKLESHFISAEVQSAMHQGHQENCYTQITRSHWNIAKEIYCNYLSSLWNTLQGIQIRRDRRPNI